MQQRATREYSKLQIRPQVLNAEIGRQQPSLQPSPPLNLFRAFGHPNNFNSLIPTTMLPDTNHQ